MHVVESGLGRLGPIGVAATPDQHAATADGDGRVSLPIHRCEVRRRELGRIELTEQPDSQAADSDGRVQWGQDFRG
jgi:hypothetical protein